MIVLNLGWIILASILSIGVALKSFNIKVNNEYIWAISGLGAIYLVYAINSYLYGDFLFGGVYAYFCFALFDKYNNLAGNKINLINH